MSRTTPYIGVAVHLGQDLALKLHKMSFSNISYYFILQWTFTTSLKKKRQFSFTFLGETYSLKVYISVMTLPAWLEMLGLVYGVNVQSHLQ